MAGNSPRAFASCEDQPRHGLSSIQDRVRQIVFGSRAAIPGVLLDETSALEAGASSIRLSLGPEFGYKPKAPLLSPIFFDHKSQPARPITTTVSPQNPTGLLRFHDGAG